MDDVTSNSDHTGSPDSSPNGAQRSESELVPPKRRFTQRFYNRYQERARLRAAGQMSPMVRPLRIFGGSTLLLIGIAIGWLPGPGFIVLAIPGAFLLAGELKIFAHFMDRVENVIIPRMRDLRARVLGGPKTAWVEENPEYWAYWKLKQELKAAKKRRAQLGDATKKSGANVERR